MKRWWGWTVVLGVGGALATGCVSRQEEGAQQVGNPYTPIQQKYKSPSASEAESGQGGSGEEGLGMPEDWQNHPSRGHEDSQGPYLIGRPQEVPRERRAAPLGVGAGPDVARKMASDQLQVIRQEDKR
jgi:hypothetical protein